MNDKSKHYYISVVIGLTALPLSHFTGLINAFCIVACIASVIFVLKEIWDCYKPKPTGFDKYDIVADYCGLFAGFILAFIIHGIIQIFKI